jgi:hypothetical protein
MAYNFLLLTSVSDCDLMLETLEEANIDLQLKKLQLVKKADSTVNSSIEIETGAPALIAEITAYQTTIPNTTDPGALAVLQDKLKKAEYKLYILNQKRATGGVFALFQQEFDGEINTLSMTAYNNLVTGIEARKAALI